MDLSKGFDCTLDDLFIAKFSTYEFDDTALKFIYAILEEGNSKWE